jgi:hypothetical protein
LIRKTGRSENISEETKFVYSNRVGVDFSVFDFVLDVGMRVPGDEGQASLLKLVMSPQHAKVLSRILLNNIEKYEKAFGPIPLPSTGGAAAGKQVMQ